MILHTLRSLVCTAAALISVGTLAMPSAWAAPSGCHISATDSEGNPLENPGPDDKRIAQALARTGVVASKFPKFSSDALERILKPAHPDGVSVGTLASFASAIEKNRRETFGKLAGSLLTLVRSLAWQYDSDIEEVLTDLLATPTCIAVSTALSEQAGALSPEQGKQISRAMSAECRAYVKAFPREIAKQWYTKAWESEMI